MTKSQYRNGKEVNMDHTDNLGHFTKIDLGLCATCARAQSISQCVDAGQLNVPPWQQPITLSLTKVMLD